MRTVWAFRKHLVRSLAGAGIAALVAVVPALAFQQAPAFDAQVQSGALPALEERLPAQPLVVVPHDSVGTYGGALNLGIMGPGDWFLLVRTLGYEPLVTWNAGWDAIEPNVAESFEVNADAMQFTFRIREGLRWSDGVAFTADDILFWYEDVIQNTELTPAVPARLQAGGAAARLVKVDDMTVRFEFDSPNGLFLQYIAYNRNGLQPTMWPKHYFSQFHVRYNPEADAEAQAAGLQGWAELFQQRASDIDWPWRFNAEVPVLHAWILQESLVEGATRIIAERNPYYWKVDPEGNQLPYIDRLVYDLVQDQETLLLKALNGEIDMQDRNLGTNSNKAVLFDGQAAGGYTFYDIDLSDMNTGVVSLNLTIPDDAKRAVFQNRDFRVALSHAINRQEIIDLIHVGVGEPWQLAPRPGTAIFNEELAKQYTEYDPAAAGAMLDPILPMGANGLRTYPDGTPFTLTLEVADAHGLSFPDVAEILTRYWREVGIDAQFRVIDRTLLDERRVANVIDGTIWRGFGGAVDGLVDARWYLPASDDADYAAPWGFWYEGRDGAPEPPQSVQDHLAIYSAVKAAPDIETQIAEFKRLLEKSTEEFYAMGISLPGRGYGVVDVNLRNVQAVSPGGGDLPNPAQMRFEQFYWAAQ
jgi:peptide/nickel transport system substrate-binding protein